MGTLALRALLWWFLLHGLYGSKISDKSSVQVSYYFRNYLSGPIDGKFEVKAQDAMIAYAGPLPKSTDPAITFIRRWSIWSDYTAAFTTSGNAGVSFTYCPIITVYNNGESVMFACPKAHGMHWVTVVDAEETTAFMETIEYTIIGTADAPVNLRNTLNSIRRFDISKVENRSYVAGDGVTPYDWVATGDPPRTATTLVPLPVYPPDKYALSDPIDIVKSDYCYLWSFKLKEKSRVGFSFREAEPGIRISKLGSYVLMELDMWIVESSAIDQSEINPYQQGRVNINFYSRELTSRFAQKGLLPCLRQVHPAVEITSDITYVEAKDTELRSPHWRVGIKIHTDTVIAELSDITFTISSRQHVALFRCFVGDTRVFVHVRDFDFIDELQTDRNQVAWEYTKGGKILMDYLRLKVRHIWGHNTVYLGPKWGRIYQPGPMRRDLVVLSNACIVQEMAIAVAGRVYIAEQFLRNSHKHLNEILLPGLDDDESDSGEDGNFERHRKYFPVADIAFTPTHVAILMDDASVYLHSHSISIKGFAYIIETRKHRLQSFAKRRWCARTSTPKTSNMVIPAYSRTGNIILLQIFPTEGIVSLWIPDPTKNCLASGGDVFKQTKSTIQAAANETCIHKSILANRSDERGLPIVPDTSKCNKKYDIRREKKPVNLDDLTHFLMNQGKLVGKFDPHYPKGLTVAVHKSSDDWSNYNLALIFELDKSDKEHNAHIKVLREQGLELLNTVEATQFMPKIAALNYQLHSIEFTAVEKRFITGVQFVSKELENSEFKFTMMITTLKAENMPVVLHPTGPSEPVTLDVTVAFPGVFLVRKSAFILTGDNKEQDLHRVKIYPINTAIPTYVIDLGDVFVFSTIESQYARPLTYFRREKVMQVIKQNTKNSNTDDKRRRKTIFLEESDRSPVFKEKGKNLSVPTYLKMLQYSFFIYKPGHMGEDLGEKVFDLVVTEQALISILERRSRTDPNANKTVGEPHEIEVAQRVFIGSAVTLDTLREVKPFVEDEHFFQMSTNDGEILYGKFTDRPASIYPACTDDERKAIQTNASSSRSCIYQPPDKKDAYCVLPDDGSIVIKQPCRGVEKLENVTTKKLRLCTSSGSYNQGCLYLPTGELPPILLPYKELNTAKITSIPFYSLLNGIIEAVPERKIFEYFRGNKSKNPVAAGSGESQYKRNIKEDRVCPFSAFSVSYEKIAYVEIGFTTRLTGVVSYIGKNVPTEAELIVDYENLPGMQIKIHSGIGQEGDQTTLTKTIDISVSLVDLDLLKMKERELLNTEYSSTVNVARETTEYFIITIRPSIVNLRCNKEDLFVTVQYVVGCCPYNRMRLLAEASPLKQIPIINDETETIDKERDWVRHEDHLLVPIEHVWHRQRLRFGCENKICKIPYANLFKDQVYDISWRDSFIPQFEQFLTSISRLVTANVVLYDMLSHDTVFNVTQLEARCYHNGSIPKDQNDDRAKTWYHRLLESTKYIGKRSHEREDVYKFYSDCYDSTVMEREKPLKLSSQYYRLVNRTNFNRLRFDVLKPLRTKNRNQIYIFRAAVINTEYNRFTYCQLMDTFFLLRVTGLPTPRQGLSGTDSAAIILILLLFFVIVYLIFYKFYTWKLDIPELSGTGLEDDENATAWEGDVKSDHVMARVANRVNDMLKWRRKTLQKKLQQKDGPSTSTSANPALASVSKPKAKALWGSSVDNW